jgi:hypothetical protein
MVLASGFRVHVPPKELFLYICKKYFFKFTPLEHGTFRYYTLLFANSNSYRRFFVPKGLEHTGTKLQKANKSYLFEFFCFRTMYKIIYLGNYEKKKS